VIDTIVFAETVDVVIGKVAYVTPAGTVTDAGTDAAALPLESITTAPPAGAAEDKVTFPVELPPPTTDDGLTVSDESGEVTESVADFETPPANPVIVTDFIAVTALVVTVNVAES
jgi:hypothetical protein